MSRIILTLLFVLGAVVLGTGYIRQSWERLGTVRKERAALDELRVEIDSIAAIRTSLVNQINALPQSDLDRIATALPETPGEPDLIIFFEYLAAKHGLALTSINTDVATENQNQQGDQPVPGGGGTKTSIDSSTERKSVVIALNIRGSYEPLLRFLDDIAHHIRLMNAKAISFSFNQEALNIIDTDVVVETYYQ